MRQHVPALVAAALIVLGGAIHGAWTHRWSYPSELRYAVDHLPKLPHHIGDWVGRDIEPDEYQRRMLIKADIKVSVQRQYVHRETGESVTLFAVCGPTGPISTHIPESCYDGAGYNLTGPTLRQTYPAGPENEAAFLCGDFRRKGAIAPSGLKFYWSYRAGPRWEASHRPRGDFAAYRSLYKIYVIRDMAMPGLSPVADKVTPKFIRVLMPELERSVFATPTKVASRS